jgi:hypothetical protein
VISTIVHSGSKSVMRHGSVRLEGRSVRVFGRSRRK